MKHIILMPALFALSACGDLAIPDFRNLGSGNAPSGEVPAMAMAPIDDTAYRDRFVAAAEAEGCIVSPTTIKQILVAAPLGNENLSELLNDLATEGVLVPSAASSSDGSDNGEMELKTANCAA